MNVCSFLPAATQMIYDMGLQHLLQGVTFECPPQALAEKKQVVRCVMEAHAYSSQEIDRIFSAAKAEGRSLYYVDEALLETLQPDIIFTQDVCEVCQIDTACTSAAVARLTKQPLVIALTPQNLEDVFGCAVTIAQALGVPAAAAQYLAGLQKRLDNVLDALRFYKMPLRRVMLMEWMAPIYNCGHWIPYQVALAGGTDMLGNPGGESTVTPWEKLQRYNPEVLVIAPCGFAIQRAREELHLLTNKIGWEELLAVKNNAVYLADFDLFTQPSPGGLTDGVELLAALFHPDLFAVPSHLQHKYMRYEAAYASI